MACLVCVDGGFGLVNLDKNVMLLELWGFDGAEGNIGGAYAGPACGFLIFGSMVRLRLQREQGECGLKRG